MGFQVNIVTSCYKDGLNGVGLVGKLPDTLIRTLSTRHLIPTTLMGHSSDRIYNAVVGLAPDQFRYKLKVFVIGASSPRKLFGTIQLIAKASIWWNHMASVIILDHSAGCKKTMSSLYVAWKSDLLNAKVMCYRLDNRRAIFYYNPFTNYAPISWKSLSVMLGKNRHPFTPFWREHLANDTICRDLDFIKTNNLGMYEITVEGDDKSFYNKAKGFKRLIQAVADRRRLMYVIFRSLNATAKFTGRSSDDLPIDAEMNMRYATAAGNRPRTYPYQQIGTVIVSKFTGHKTQLEKIASVTDMNSRIGTIVVYLITMIIFKFCMHQPLGKAVLNLVRMTCNTAFTNLPHNTAPRMYITSLLFFVVTMQGIYQSDLASLLTKKVPYRNIDTIEDLANGDYKIYGTVPRFFFRGDPTSFQERYTRVENQEACVDRVVTDFTAVCVEFPAGLVLDMARKYDLHLSRELLGVVTRGFKIQPSWYLQDQLNTILGRLMEGDLFEAWDLHCDPVQLKDFQFDKEVLLNTDFRVLELKDLLFAFVILGVGLACAAIVFIIEVAIF